jgi:hypothetical protein
MADENSKVQNNVRMPMAKNVIRVAGKMLFSFKYNSARIMHNNCIDEANSRTTIAEQIEKGQENSRNGVNIVSIQYQLPQFSWHDALDYGLQGGM